MFSVFSNFLSPYIEQGLMRDEEQTPSQIYNQLSIAYNQGSEGVKNATRWFVPYYEQQDPDDYDYGLLEYIWSNKPLQELIRWFNMKCLPSFTTLSYQTIAVRVRIFTSKLNKLVEEGIVDKEPAIKIHLNLVETLEKEKSLIVNEELPFLP